MSEILEGWFNMKFEPPWIGLRQVGSFTITKILQLVVFVEVSYKVSYANVRIWQNSKENFNTIILAKHSVKMDKNKF